MNIVRGIFLDKETLKAETHIHEVTDEFYNNELMQVKESETYIKIFCKMEDWEKAKLIFRSHIHSIIDKLYQAIEEIGI